MTRNLDIQILPFARLLQRPLLKGGGSGEPDVWGGALVRR